MLVWVLKKSGKGSRERGYIRYGLHLFCSTEPNVGRFPYALGQSRGVVITPHCIVSLPANPYVNPRGREQLLALTLVGKAWQGQGNEGI